MTFSISRSTKPFSILCRLPALLAIFLSTFLSAPLFAGPEPAVRAPALTETTEHDGIQVSMRLVPVGASTGSADPASALREGDDVAFEFEITDATGEPMSGAFPAAWMDLLPEGETTTAESCKTKLASFVSGSLLSQPELDLNVFYVLTMNRDASLSVVDPLFGFGGSKLLDMVLLEAPGLDWVLTPDQSRLFVSMPEADGVAVVDTATWQVLTKLRVPRPSRLALQDDGTHLWIAYEDDAVDGVAVVRVANLRMISDLRFDDAPVASGETKQIFPDRLYPDLAFSDDHRVAYLTRADAGAVTVIDAYEREVITTVQTGRTPSSIAWSTAAGMAYVGHDDGSIVAIGGGVEPRIVARMQGDAGLGALRFAPGGRFGFVPSPVSDVVHILDAAKNRIVQTGDMEPGPDQVSFSDELAYVRHRGSEIVLTIPLDQIGREGEPVPVVDFPGGQAPPGRTDRPSLAQGIVQAPGAPAVLVANPEDQVIYFYKEGMAAPMGSFKNYGRQPRSVAVVDRSLRERTPGIYRTEAALRRPGRYDVAFFMDAPRVIHCFEVEVAPNPELAEQRRRARPLLVEALPVEAGQVDETASVRFVLRDPHTQEPLDDLEDVTILTFLAPGTWQERHAARSVGDGTWEARFEPPESGAYYAFVAVPSRGLSFEKAAPTIFHVAPAGEPGGESVASMP